MANGSPKLRNAALAAALLAVAPLTVFAAGYWNVPSNFCQCMGYGNGAGYHAPLILGPITCGEWCRTNECRVPCAPTTGYGCGCSNNHYGADQTMLIEPTVLPADQSKAPPVPAAYLAPYRR